MAGRRLSWHGTACCRRQATDRTPQGPFSSGHTVLHPSVDSRYTTGTTTQVDIARATRAWVGISSSERERMRAYGAGRDDGELRPVRGGAGRTGRNEIKEVGVIRYYRKKIEGNKGKGGGAREREEGLQQRGTQDERRSRRPLLLSSCRVLPPQAPFTPAIKAMALESTRTSHLMQKLSQHCSSCHAAFEVNPSREESDDGRRTSACLPRLHHT